MNISPYFSASLRQRFNEDMIMRKLATKTQIAYTVSSKAVTFNSVIFSP